jgi:RNA-binding protein
MKSSATSSVDAMKKTQERIPLTGKQIKLLRGLGHHLDHSVIVGREGISDNLVQSCADGLQAHELIKVRLGQNCPLTKDEAARLLADRTGAHLVQLIGKTVILYRENPDLPPDLGIHLPR